MPASYETGSPTSNWRAAQQPSFRDKSACFSVVKFVMPGATDSASRSQRLERRRNWVALLRSQANSRSSDAPDNRPRNATQVIGRLALCRRNFFAVAAGPGAQVVRLWNKRSYAEPVALELTLMGAMSNSTICQPCATKDFGCPTGAQLNSLRYAK